MAAIVLADVGDLHVGSSIGLLPGDGAEAEDGMRILPSPLQSWMWANWLAFWNEVAETALRVEARRVVATVGGDIVDGDRPNGVQRWTFSRDHQVQAAVACMAPAQAIVDRWYVVPGTPYHSGAGGQAERLFARMMRARKVRGELCPASLPLLLDRVLVWIEHPSRLASLPWTRGGPANRLAAEIDADAGEHGYRPPDLVLVHHAHRVHDSGDSFRRPRVIVCPGWQPRTEYARNKNARGIVPVGGVIAVCEAGRVDARIMRYWPEPEKGVPVR